MSWHNVMTGDVGIALIIQVLKKWANQSAKNEPVISKVFPNKAH